MVEPAVGQVIDGRYELEARIGRGGMAVPDPGNRCDAMCLGDCNLRMKPSSALKMTRLFSCRTDAGEDMNKFMTSCYRQFAEPCFADN